MNFLAHLFLADANGGSLVGQLLGDFVKGSPGAHFSKRVRAAIVFHRRIDAFADRHPAARNSRRRFSVQRRRFGGVMVDLCHDHFLARHWDRYSPEPLAQFCARIYPRLQAGAAGLPERLQGLLTRMIADDWLGQYGSIDRVGLALDRTAGRVTRGERFLGAIAEVKVNYAMLERDFEIFFPDMIAFANEYSSALQQPERMGHGDV